MIDIALLWGSAVAGAAGLMRGFAGVGSGMLMAPFFVQFFGAVETVAIIVMMEIVVTVQLLPSVRRDIDWRMVGPMALAAAVFMPIGTWMLVVLDGAMVGKIVAAVVVVFSGILMTGWRYRGGRPLVATLGVGATSGVLMALTSLGNPPVMIYLLSSQDQAARNRANFTGYFGLTLAALIVLMLGAGLVGGTAVLRAAALLPLFMLGTWVGSRLFRKSNERLYRRVALSTLLASGLIALAR